MRVLATRILDRITFTLGRKSRGGGHPVPESRLDREYASGRWDHFFNEDETPRYAQLAALALETHSRPRLLDVGCGSGRLATYFNGGQLVAYLGVDLSREGLRRAAALNLLDAQFVHGDFERWRPPGKWDLIVFNEIVGYARDPGRLAASFARFLAPGGALIVSYYRSGNHGAMWRQLALQFQIVRETTVVNAQGETWDMKVLRPNP